MKIFLSSLILILLSPTLGFAKLVHYTDKNGQIHYVNTDFSKVPAEYYPQVIKQLKEEKPKVEAPLEEKKEEEVLPVGPTEEAKNLASAKVELFTGEECKECKKIELILRGNGVAFEQYDIFRHPYGVQTYQKLQGGKPPILKAGTHVISNATLNDAIQLIQQIRKGEISTSEEGEEKEKKENNDQKK
ncbi:MAG: glutaredoxin [Candidatus Omnitrophica bacterium]|nr:glutaredoxin [Candidatus Omnitrophota bacterium]